MSRTEVKRLRRYSSTAWRPVFGVAAVALGACPLSAQAISFTANDWTLDISGFLNAYVTTVDCSGDTVGGAALAGEGLGCGGNDSRTTIGNGLLPNGLITKVTTQQQGIDISGQIGLMAHTATSDAISPNSGVDVRQAFFTLGTERAGTVKLGRDYGIFGANAILTDMTLLGVGMPIQATQRGRVSLGHIGAGYTYLGHYGQVTYTSPGASGLVFSGGIFSPVNNTNSYDAGAAPQVQAQLSYSASGFKVWVGGKTQKFEAIDEAASDPDSFNMVGGEVGGSWTGGRLGVLANVQTGKGLGILTDGDQGEVDSINYLVQTTLQVSDALKLGLNGGISRNRDEEAGTGGLKQNGNLTLGAYYALTKNVTLIGEVGQTRSKAFSGDEAKMTGVSAGGFLSF